MKRITLKYFLFFKHRFFVGFLWLCFPDGQCDLLEKTLATKAQRHEALTASIIFLWAFVPSWQKTLNCKHFIFPLLIGLWHHSLQALSVLIFFVHTYNLRSTFSKACLLFISKTAHCWSPHPLKGGLKIVNQTAHCCIELQNVQVSSDEPELRWHNGSLIVAMQLVNKKILA